jgi:aspartate/methionine/tyrosine aminotransferase
VCDEVYYKMVYPGFENISFGDLTVDVPVIVLNG